MRQNLDRFDKYFYTRKLRFGKSDLHPVEPSTAYFAIPVATHVKCCVGSPPPDIGNPLVFSEFQENNFQD